MMIEGDYVTASAFDLYRKAYLQYKGKWIGSSLKYMHLPNGPKDYILMEFEESLEYYKINVETTGDAVVITLEYYPDDPTPRLVEYMQSLTLPSGYYLCYYDGHDGRWLMLHNSSRGEANATYNRLYQKYFKNQIYMCIIKA